MKKASSKSSGKTTLNPSLAIDNFPDFPGSEDIYRTIVENSNDDIFIIDRDDKIRFANLHAARRFHLKRSEILGMQRAKLFPESIYRSQSESLNRVFESGEAEMIESKSAFGPIELWLNTWLIPMKSKSGATTSILGISRDVTQKKRSEKTTLDHHLQIQAFQQVIIHLSHHESLASGNTAEFFAFMAESSSQAMNVERVGVWLFSQDKRELICQHLFERKTGAHSHSQALLTKDYPQYFEQLNSQLTLQADQAQSDPRLAEFMEAYLVPLGITSMLDSAISLSGQTVGVICHEHTGPQRQWTDLEINFSNQLATLAAAVLANDERCRALEDLKRQQAELAEVHNLYRQVIENANGVPYARDLVSDKYEWFGQGIEGLVGVSANKIDRNIWGEIIREIHLNDSYRVKDHKEYIRLFKEGKIERYRVDLRVKTYSGEEKWLSDCSLPVRDETGQLVGTRGILQDITDWKLAEQTVKNQNSFLTNVLESLDHPFYVIDVADYTIALANSRTNQKHNNGKSTCYAVTRNRDNPCSNDKNPCPMAIIRKTHKSTIVEHHYSDGNGEQRTVEIHGHPIFDENGEIRQIIEYSIDITDRKKADLARDAALREAQRANRVKSNFLANMTHEIRTPLNGIVGFADLLKHDIAKLGAAEVTKYLEYINTSTERILETIHGILDISQLEAESFQVTIHQVKLDKLVRELVLEQAGKAAEKGLELKYHSRTREPVILADHYCVTHALSNLIANAIKYTREGFIDISIFRDGPAIIVRIADTGIGMSREFLKRIYEPYTQESEGYGKRFQGIGLGLALTRRYLDLVGAKIAVRSKKGQGTVFTLTFPTP